VFLVPQFAGKLAGLTGGPFWRLDPDGVFVWNTLHHLYQLVLTVLMMLALNRRLGDWGFNLRQREESLRLFGWFALYFPLGVIGMRWSALKT